MSKHFEDIGKLKGRLSQDFDMKGKDKQVCMDSIIHACDVSNPVKVWEVCFSWTNVVMQEFFE